MLWSQPNNQQPAVMGKGMRATCLLNTDVERVRVKAAVIVTDGWQTFASDSEMVAWVRQNLHQKWPRLTLAANARVEAIVAYRGDKEALRQKMVTLLAHYLSLQLCDLEQLEIEFFEQEQSGQKSYCIVAHEPLQRGKMSLV